MVKKIADVSVVAANYNNGCYLPDFISSINDSSILPKELIIVDDGSFDDSLKVLESFSHLPFLKIIKFEKNRGFCEALNAGIESAGGDYIMRIDPDDICTKDRIHTQVNFLEENKGVDVVGSNVTYFHFETKQEILRSNFPADHSSIEAKYRKGDHGVQHPSTMIRAKVMKAFRYNQINMKVEDYEIFARMIKSGHRFANIKEPLTRMRVHSQSISSNIQYSTIERTFQIRDEIFGTSTSRWTTQFYYWYMLNYKKFMISKNQYMKPIYLMLATVCQPSKLIDRIF